MRFPTIEPPGPVLGTVVLLHGFGRRPGHLDDLATRLAGLGARVVRPALSAWWWPTCTNNTRFLDRVADAIAQTCGPGPVVVVGHSAGAAAGSWIAARLIRRGSRVSSVILVDGVESPLRAIRRSWPVLQHVAVLAICGEPGPCNRDGALGGWLRRQQHDEEPALTIVDVPGMGHGDVEGAGTGIYVRMCRDDADAPQRDVLIGLITDAVSRGIEAPAK